MKSLHNHRERETVLWQLPFLILCLLRRLAARRPTLSLPLHAHHSPTAFFPGPSPSRIHRALEDLWRSTALPSHAVPAGDGRAALARGSGPCRRSAAPAVPERDVWRERSWLRGWSRRPPHAQGEGGVETGTARGVVIGERGLTRGLEERRCRRRQAPLRRRHLQTRARHRSRRHRPGAALAAAVFRHALGSVAEAHGHLLAPGSAIS